MDKERRRSTRFRVRNCVIQYTPDGLMAWIRKSDGDHPLVDLSMSGMRFLAEERLEPGAQIHITLYVPAFEKPVALRGNVAWCRPHIGSQYGQTPRDMFAVGVRFTRLDEESERMLKRIATDGKLRSLQRVVERPSGGQSSLTG